MIKLEFIVLDKAGEEIEWLCHFLKDITVWPKLVSAICINYDSQSAIGKAKTNRVKYTDHP